MYFCAVCLPRQTLVCTVRPARTTGVGRTTSRQRVGHALFLVQWGMFPVFSPPIERFLATQPWFSAQAQQQQAAIVAQVFTVSAARGQIILAANERPEGWYGVLSGLAKISGRATSGRRADFLGVATGDWFGEGAVLKNEPRRYQVFALRDTELLCLPSAAFHALFASSVAFNQFLVRCLNLRVSQAMAVIEAGRTRSPEHRIALALSPLFWSRTRQLDLTQDELAHLAGMSRQTANRALNALQERGLIQLTLNRIKVLDDTALSRLLE